MLDAIALTKYGGILGTLILAGFGFPIPEEIPIVAAGAMVGHDAQEVAFHQDWAGAMGGGMVAHLAPSSKGVARWWIMLPICIFGVVFGDTVLFCIGRFWGRKLLRSAWVQRRVLPPEKQASIETNFHNNGILILLAARFTPGIRTPVFIMAGVLKMPISRFLLADMLYAIPGVNLLFWLAYMFTDQFVMAMNAVDEYRPLAAAIILGIVAAVVIYKFATSRSISTGDVKEIPIYIKPVGVVTHAVEQVVEKTVQKTVQTAAMVVDKVTHSHSSQKAIDSVAVTDASKDYPTRMIEVKAIGPPRRPTTTSPG